MVSCSININKKTILCLLLAVFCGLASPIHAADPPAIPVEVEIYLIDLVKIDDVEQNFVANAYLEVRWKDPTLAHDGPRSTVRRLANVWTPRIQVVNQQSVYRSLPQTVEIAPDGTVFQRQRLWGKFSQRLALSRFPFDEQTLEIQVVSVTTEGEGVTLLNSPNSEISKSFSIIDWAITGYNFSEGTLPLGVKGADVSAIVLALEVKRHQNHYLSKIVFPLILIVAMSMLVFWIDPAQSGTQISVGATAMLTLIAYRFAVGASLPKLPFMTLLDYFIMGSTLLVFTSLVMVIWTSSLARRERTEQARRIDLTARWVMPLLFLLVTLETLYLNMFV